MTSTPTQTARIETRSGLILDMRAAGPSDALLLQQLYEGTPPEELRFRFVPVPDAWRNDPGSPLEIFLALAGDQLTSAAMIARDATRENAEVVVALDHRWRGQGIGFAMLEYAASQAKQRGVKLLWSVETHGNPSGMKAALEFGFISRALPGDLDWVQLELRL